MNSGTHPEQASAVELARNTAAMRTPFLIAAVIVLAAFIGCALPTSP